jgi:hypothetical protein
MFGYAVFIANTKKIVKVMTSVFFAENPPKGPLDVPVPQTVDKGVRHGCDHGVHH